jgi:hypothetical protein
MSPIKNDPTAGTGLTGSGVDQSSVVAEPEPPAHRDVGQSWKVRSTMGHSSVGSMDTGVKHSRGELFVWYLVE